MKVTNKVIIELTQDEAIQLAQVLPSCDVFRGYEGYDENKEFSQTLKEKICDQLDMNSWDL